MILLEPGTYNRASGEEFPILVPPGVILLGNEANQGKEIILEGGGAYRSASLGQQTVTLVLGSKAQLRGVTVINRATNGTGVWIEAADPAMQNCTLRNCGREGLVAVGTANPLIRDNLFLQNQTSGMTLLRNTKGEVWGNVCRQMSIGLALGDDSAPLVARNQFLENQTGVAIAGRARPVLRANLIENSGESGLVIQGSAVADLGSEQDPANNIFRNNRTYDLNNSTNQGLVSVGNQVNPQRNRGAIDFKASQLPEPRPLPEPIAIALPPGINSPTVAPSPGSQPSPAAGGTGSGDIQGHWAAAFIQSLIERNILSGFPDGSFRPESSLTRAEYAAVIAKAFNQPLKRPAMDFQDVPGNFWGAQAILKANRMGFLAGFPDGTFRANQQLTRVQAIVALVSGLGLTGGSPGLLEVYSDRAQIPSYATNAIATATQNRLIVNHPQLNLLEPLRPIRRGEIAVMVYQALVALRQVPVISFSHIPQPLVHSTLTDVQGHWAEPFVRAMVDQNLLRGFSDGSFQPDAAVSRAEYAGMIAKAFEPVARYPEPNFQDITANFWARSAILQATRGGFLAGYSNSRFQPDRPILRIQVLLSLVSGLKLTGGHLGLVNRLADQALIPKYARQAIATALHNRIVVNYPEVDCLSPNREATRAEVAAMIYQGLYQRQRVPALPSAYVVIPR
ncbi:MAG: DUF1565 domain-containing protein [Synechococcales cyanobacterium RM1_1_8]|nr:DUF1565 domain-containing protein [Synechococcales cyanobacterium RM1_1_8]